MKEASIAAFSLHKYTIANFSIKEMKGGGDPLSIGFQPSGIYNEKNGEYVMYLDFAASENPKDVTTDGKHTNPVITASLKAVFKFEPIIIKDAIPSYFYKNAIAIVFPYLRAFISTLTLQAGINLIMLPIMNLSGLEQLLITNTKIEA